MDFTQLALDWQSSENLTLLNPRLPVDQARQLNELAKFLTENWKLTGHIFIATSGSTSGGTRLVALSKKAILHSAQAVNEFLKITDKDVWTLVLPTFHVGGLGILARAYLSRSKVVLGLPEDQKWDANFFYQLIKEENVSLCSLVPSQVHDLVKANFIAPKAMRAIVVGGAELTEDLYLQARRLGWPLLPSYGMTETCSQVATATIESLQQQTYPKLELLPRVQAKTNEEGMLEFQSGSLLTCYAAFAQGEQIRVWDPKALDDWFAAEDRGQVSGREIKVFGRGGDFIKIGGESTNLFELRKVLRSSVLSLNCDEQQFVLIDQSSSRLGAEIHLVTDCRQADQINQVSELYNQKVLPFEKIRGIHTFEVIPRTDLGKPLWAEIKRSLK